MMFRACAIAAAIAIAWIANADAASKSGTTAPSSPGPTAIERALFEQGRSEERIAFGLERPLIFGIALLRDRSLSDLTTTERLFSKTGDATGAASLSASLETLRPLIETGDYERVNRDLWGSTVIEPYGTKAPPNPQAWWVVEAGMASVDADAARVDLLANDLQSIHPLWLAGHVEYAGRFGSIVPAGGSEAAAAMQPLFQIDSELNSPKSASGNSPVPAVSQTQLESYEAELSVRLAAVFPVAPYPAIPYGIGPIADARRGLAISTANQMIAVPALLGQRDSQEFIDALFDSLKVQTDDPRLLAALADARAQFAVPEHADAFQRSPRWDASSSDFHLYYRGISEERVRQMMIGGFAGQAYFNASTDRDATSDAAFRKEIGANADLDVAIPGLSVARHDLASAKAGDWIDIRAKSLIIVDLVMGQT